MNKGFYITSNFDINVDSLDIEDSFEFRSEIDLRNFPDVLKIYKPISTEIGFYFINKLGGVIAFQFISENITEEKALEIYSNYSEPEDNYQYYEKLLKNIENTFGEKRIPFSISNLSINLFEEKVKWDYYRLNSDSIQYFVECSFILLLTIVKPVWNGIKRISKKARQPIGPNASVEFRIDKKNTVARTTKKHQHKSNEKGF